MVFFSTFQFNLLVVSNLFPVDAFQIYYTICMLYVRLMMWLYASLVYFGLCYLDLQMSAALFLPCSVVILNSGACNPGKINEPSLTIPAPYFAGLLDFKFLLKGEGDRDLCILEEGANRMLQAGTMEGEAGPTAQFKVPTKGGIQLLQLPVSIQADPVSPFALAASWSSLKKNLQSHGSTIAGVLDVIQDGVHPVVATELKNETQALELDLEHYEVPTPDAIASSALQNPPNPASDSSELHQKSCPVPAPFYGESRLYRIRGGDTSVPCDLNIAEIKSTNICKDGSIPVKVRAYSMCCAFVCCMFFCSCFTIF